MAYFRKLPSGKWRAEIVKAGTRESRGGFDTKADAKAWAAQIESDLAAGKMGRWPSKTVGDALTRYKHEVSAGKGSSRFEQGLIDRLLRDFPALCSQPFADTHPDQLKAWMDARLGSVKPATVQREANLLRNLWTVGAKQWRWCPMESPFRFLALPGKQPPRERRVHWTEVRRVLRRLGYLPGKPPHNTQCQIAHAWLIALRTAMRSGEVLGLTQQAVNLQTRVVRLDKHKTQHHTGRPRFVPITKQAARLLGVLCWAAENRQKTGNTELHTGNTEPHTGTIPAKNRTHTGKDGKLFTVTAASKDALFRRALDQCGIVGMTFHDSRAEALTLLSRRVDLLTLQKISGHADVNVLANAYFRTTPEEIAARL